MTATQDWGGAPVAEVRRDRIPQGWRLSGSMAAVGLVLVLPKYSDITAFSLSMATFLAAGLSGRWLRASTVMTVALTIVFIPLGVTTLAAFAVDIPLLMACARRNLRVRNLTAILAAALQTAISAPMSGDEGELLLNLLSCLSLIAAAWVLGSWISHYTNRIARLERERNRKIHEVRVSLARDLHDTVASATNRIIMRCEQAKLRGINDSAMLQDIDFVLREGRQSVVDLRSILTALRIHALEPEEGIWHIDSLQVTLNECTNRLRQEGFEIALSLEIDEESLSPINKDTVGKILLEATTNIIKHSALKSKCRILLEQHEESVEIAVINQFTSATRRPGNTSFGLLGLRERVHLLGGEFEAAPTGINWVVQAQLPIRG